MSKLISIIYAELNNQVLEELPAAGATPTATYTLGSQILSQEKSGTVLHLLPDGHGSTRSLTDGSGAVQNTFTYDGYGNLLASNATPQTVILYTGERFDSDIRQYYLRNRYFNPVTGRFAEQDQLDGTLQDPLSLHKYTYCQNNPVDRHDPSGNDGDLLSLAFSMSIGASLDMQYNRVVLKQGYIAAKKVTEIGAATESLWEIVGQDKTADTATIIVHGVSGHQNGWSQSTETPFQQDLSFDKGQTPTPGIDGDPLKHDFYEFDWGGFSIANAPPFLIPIKSVHEMALVHLQMAEFYVWMNGYANIDVISHSWGTTLSYELMNNSSIEVHDWVTMGSPLKQTTSKPPMNTGKWINCYDSNDPVTHLEMYPPFPDVYGPFLTLSEEVLNEIVEFPRDFVGWVFACRKCVGNKSQGRCLSVA